MRRALALVAVLAVVAVPAARAQDDPGPMVSQDVRVEMSDGVEVLVRLSGRGPLVDGHLPARPVIAEFSPYGQGCCAELAGPAYNQLQVHIRGTGDSDGSFDALGPRSQQDLAEVLAWACAAPWSDGNLGLWGFSASAIMVYNSLHQDLPCLRTAVLGAGTHELYRDLLYPGGIPNGVPALGVFALIGAPTLPLLPDRLGRDPLSLVPVVGGLGQLAVDYLAHPTLDSWWAERGMRGDVNGVPMLLVTGFFDVESRGPFVAWDELRDQGSHLYVVGAHDGVPAGSGGAGEVTARWFDRYLRGIDNGVDREPAVQLWMADGDRAAMLAGDFVTASGTDWPLPGTEWVDLHPAAGGGLDLDPSAAASTVASVPIQSLFSATDPYTTSLLGVFNGSPELTTMDLPQTLGPYWTTAPLERDVTLVGPATAELVVTSTSPETDLWVVVSDVAPDGSAHPMAAGRLRTSFPDLDEARTVRDAAGRVLRPVNDVSAKRFVPIGTEHRYTVELWPIGNRFQAGHAIRLHLVGASMYHEPTLTGLNLVRLGGADGGSVLRVPVLPGDDLPAALGVAAPAAPSVPTPAAVTPRVDATAAAGAGAGLPATGGALPLAAAALALAAALSGRRGARRRPG